MRAACKYERRPGIRNAAQGRGGRVLDDYGIGMTKCTPDQIVRREYLHRLFHYCLANKRLLVAVLTCGVVGFSVTFVFPWLIGSLIDDVLAPSAARSPEQLQSHLRFIVTCGAGAAVVAAVAGWGRGHFTMKLGNRIVTMLRSDLFDHLQRLSLHFYSHQRTGGIVWRLMHEVHGVNGLIHAGVILVLLDVFNLVITMGLLLSISVPLAVSTFVVMPLYVLTFRVFNPRVRRVSEQVTQHFGKLSSNVHEQISAMPLIKCYAAEDREAARFMADNEDHYRYVVAQSRVGHAVGAIGEMWMHLGTTLILGVGGYLALTQGRISAGDITRFVGYAGILYGPLKRFADLDMVYQNSLASVRRVLRVFEIEPQIREKAGAIEHVHEYGSIRYENVRFHYEQDTDEARIRLDEDEPDDSPFKLHGGGGGPDPRWVLSGIDLEIRPGERVALVGPSGSGKTTLANLLPRLYDAVDGRITIDGIDTRDYSLKSLRMAIAVVQQDSFLFSGTVRDNIFYGRPDAAEPELVAATRAANAHDFISKLPDGYDTVLGERGVNLSGGQRQRISIARALLKDPKILILDEATSALDAESEALVQEALERLMQGRTCMIIAHRLSTVRSADRIFALKDGRIVETGRHDELLARNGLYARLVRQQLSSVRLHQDDGPAPHLGYVEAPSRRAG